MTKWWELDPARWEREQQALEAAGITFEVDEGARSKGRLTLNLTKLWDGQPLRLVAHYPFNYPFANPMVVAPTLDLARHQTPGSKQLCMLRRNGEDWKPATDTLSSLIDQQLPRVFAGQPGQPEEDLNGKEAEPVTAFLHPQQGSFVGFPAFDISTLPDKGTFKIGLVQLNPLRGTVIEVLDQQGRVLFSSEARSRENFTKRPIVEGRWVKLAERPKVGDANDFLKLAAESDANLSRPAWKPLPNTDVRIDLLALLFADELTWKGAEGNAIVVSRSIGNKTKTVGSTDRALHRVELESRTNYFRRDPTAEGLQKGCVSLVGTGSIGSPAAKWLAQAGIGELRLFDHDVLDAGNAIRWELGRDYAGHHKVTVLHAVLSENFPYTTVVPTTLRIGDASSDDMAWLDKAYEGLVNGVTCLFDASASIGVSNYLSAFARHQGIPHVWMHASNGGWAGLVGRASGKPEDFCWMCHLYYLDDQDAEVKIPKLRSAPESAEVQPAGCLDPTFVGAQVDLSEVSLMGVRVVMDEVLVHVGAQPATQYDWNVAVVDLRDEAGRPQLPKWTPYKLPRHAKCTNH
ncbi:ThiF family adenylyltransferase [Noviluteimonas gilva]|uniref:THIF-type NAD/FAD binding fold domain-containing protein n=1 Tax=Noviluteimonas gilva TaxID=2682097 RepID=A0A7C9LFU6_9GAMM|nr:ThiF family adenylyltransferase [Lysobacter gilvus]MUV13341.1 hypothetical protein [Lysobacter gilvus]